VVQPAVVYQVGGWAVPGSPGPHLRVLRRTAADV